ncbi:CZB domain-containing protein, partial [Klebsiella michiganensis]
MGWKTRVRAYLDGQEGLSRSEAVSDKECRLGHWYFSEGQACCGDQPAFRAMAAPHARLHQGHCCKVSDEAAFCLIQRPYISKTLLT